MGERTPLEKPEPLRVPLVRTKDAEMLIKRAASKPTDGKLMPTRRQRRA
jgi:hypothetical protein